MRLPLARLRSITLSGEESGLGLSAGERADAQLLVALRESSGGRYRRRGAPEASRASAASRLLGSSADLLAIRRLSTLQRYAAGE